MGSANDTLVVDVARAKPGTRTQAEIEALYVSQARLLPR